jgi:hypothetical protein
MATKRMIARENRRRSYDARFANREALKKIIKNPASSPEAVMEAVVKLQA